MANIHEMSGDLGMPLSVGIPGNDGATFTPRISEDGTLEWENNKGLDNPDPVNIRGPIGPNGDPFTYDDFSAEQLESLKGVGIKSVAVKSMMGAGNVVLGKTITITLTDGTQTSFSITNGTKGAKGDKGEKGDPGDVSHIVDRTTGKTYALYVDNGKLMMEEV